MKRPSYRDAVAFLAFNDNADEDEIENVQSSISVGLVADMFGVDTTRVARDVMRVRNICKGERQ